MQINAILPTGRDYKTIPIFGYTTKGLPGLEIIGIPGKSRQIKEKIIYLTRENNIKPPMRRFVLCLDHIQGLSKSDLEGSSWLELPLLLMFWSLFQHIKIYKLDRCLTLGQISLDGKINVELEDIKHIKEIYETMDYKFILPKKYHDDFKDSLLPLEDILAHTFFFK